MERCIFSLCLTEIITLQSQLGVIKQIITSLFLNSCLI